MSTTCENQVCSEKFKNMEQKIEEMKSEQDKMKSQISENERKVDKIDSQLSIKLIQLEAKLDVHTKLVGDKVDGIAREIKETNEKVEKKMDEYLLATNSNRNNNNDMFKDWIIKLGMKLLEYGVYGGVLYAVAKGLNLF